MRRLHRGGVGGPSENDDFLVYFVLFWYIFESREYHQSIRFVQSFKTQSEKLKLVIFWIFNVFLLFWASLMVQEAYLMVPNAPDIDPISIIERSLIDP